MIDLRTSSTPPSLHLQEPFDQPKNKITALFTEQINALLSEIEKYSTTAPESQKNLKENLFKIQSELKIKKQTLNTSLDEIALEDLTEDIKLDLRLASAKVTGVIQSQSLIGKTPDDQLFAIQDSISSFIETITASLDKEETKTSKETFNVINLAPIKSYFITHPISSSFSYTNLLRSIGYEVGKTILQTVWKPSITNEQRIRLQEIGISDPEAFYETDKKMTDFIFSLLDAFQSRGLKTLYNGEKKELIFPDSTLSDIEEIIQELLGKYSWYPFQQCLPYFYLHNQTIYCKPKNLFIFDFKFQKPSLKEWTSYLNSPSELQTENDISLPSGKVLSQEDFTTHLFFRNTLEKHNVFRFLASFLTSPLFQEQYNLFLENMIQENWFEFYLTEPKTLAYLALISFLDDQLNQEDLFMIHMVASALQQATLEEPVTLTVLQEKNVSDYLEKTGHPLFDSNISVLKTKKEQREARQTLISNLKHKSPIQRTAIAYTFSFSLQKAEWPIEQPIFFTEKWNPWTSMGFQKDSPPKAIILPPLLFLELLKIASPLKTPPPSKHTWMFGFNNEKESIQALKKGRPISLASPLFTLPKDVHGYNTKKQLGITKHDYYHQIIDWHNPHARLFIELGTELLKTAESQQSTSLENIGISFLDREMTPYLLEVDPNKAFWLSIIKQVSKETALDSNSYSHLFSLLKRILPSQLLKLDLIESVADDRLQKSKEALSSEKTALYLQEAKFLNDFIEEMTSSCDPLLFTYLQDSEDSY